MGTKSSVLKPSSSIENDFEGVVVENKITDVTGADKKTEEELIQEKHQIYLNNMFKLKSLFKKLDPSVLNQLGKIQGELKVSCKYTHSLLLVKVLLAQDLTAKDIRGERTDSYVKVELLIKNELRNAEGYLNTTKIIKNSLDPVYNEIFSFQIEENDLQFAKLRFSVLSHDSATEDDFIGEAYFDANCFFGDKSENLKTEWLQLKPKIDFEIGGSIKVKIEHKIPNNLLLTVESAENVGKATEETQLLVRVYIPGVPYLHKTTAKVIENKKAIWNETFELPVLKEELINKYVVLVFLDGTQKDLYLGETHISLEKVFVNSYERDEFPIQDLRGSVVARSRWSSNNMESREFSQALQAHAQYLHPNFVFSSKIQQAGNQAISVRVPKVSANSRLRLYNGTLVH